MTPGWLLRRSDCGSSGIAPTTLQLHFVCIPRSEPSVPRLSRTRQPSSTMRAEFSHSVLPGRFARAPLRRQAPPRLSRVCAPHCTVCAARAPTSWHVPPHFAAPRAYATPPFYAATFSAPPRDVRSTYVVVVARRSRRRSPVRQFRFVPDVVCVPANAFTGVAAHAHYSKRFRERGSGDNPAFSPCAHSPPAPPYHGDIL